MPPKTSLRPRCPVNVKLALLLLPCVLVVFGLSYFYSSYISRQQFEQGLELKHQRLMRIANLLGEPIWQSDTDRVAEILQLLTHDSDLLRVEVLDDSGQILAKQVSTLSGHVPVERQYHLPIQLGDARFGSVEPLGWVNADVGAQSLHRQEFERTLQTTLILLTMLGLVGMALLLFQAWVIKRPLAHLMASIRQSRESGQFCPVELPAPEDEFGIIISSYNDLHAQLDEKHRSLQQNEQRFRNLYNQTPALLFTLSDRGIIEDVSEHFLAHLGFRGDQVIGTALADLIADDPDQEEVNYLMDTLRDKYRAQIHVQINNAEGVLHSMRIDATRELGSSHTLAVMTDITSLNDALNTIEQQANFDALTSLPNRHFFSLLLSEQLNIDEIRRNRVAVLFVDLDRFKYVNDTHGHQTGDQLLRAAAQRIQSLLAPGDYVARLGGDEFAVLVHNVTDHETLRHLANDLIAGLEKSFVIDKCTMHISASIGIAISGNDLNSPDRLLKSADLAMYRAKSEGRGRACIFVPEDEERTLKRVDTESLLRESLKEGYFELHYQPVVRLNGARLVGAEALIRLRHPERGLMAPGDFIDVAEETGLIVPMGEWVLNEGLRQLSEWHCLYDTDLYLSLNVSSQQLQGDRFVHALSEALDTHQVSPRYVVLEITESMLLHNTRQILRVMRQIKRLGCQLSMDDFGTGYSSLSYLQKFPLDVLKIDRSFINDIEQNRVHRALVHAIVTMSRALRLKVITEGIETTGQLGYLKQLRCELGQGYYFSKPLAAQRFAQHYFGTAQEYISNG